MKIRNFISLSTLAMTFIVSSCGEGGSESEVGSSATAKFNTQVVDTVTSQSGHEVSLMYPADKMNILPKLTQFW